MKVQKVGNWQLARRLVATGQKRFKEATSKAVLHEAQFFRTKLVEGIREQAPGGEAFKPLAPTTLAIRRFRGFTGTKALLLRGDLRNSVAVVKEGAGAFVGVLRTAKSASGQPLVNVAAVHEFGSRPIVAKLTPKARRFLHAAFRKAGLDSSSDSPRTGIAIIRVPPRPFLRPVFEKHGQPEEVSKRFLRRLAHLFGGDFGQ